VALGDAGDPPSAPGPSARPSLERYLAEIFALAEKDAACEGSFYPALKSLLQDLAGRPGERRIEALVLPRRVEGAAPDFQILGTGNRVIGYVEAKRLGTNLREVAESRQLRRYRQAFPNLLLTNFDDFALFRGGERAGEVAIARPWVYPRLGLPPHLENAERLVALLDRFFSFTWRPRWTSKRLAQALAHRTRHLAEMILEQLDAPGQEARDLAGFYQAFSEHLIADLDPRGFADLYAQTVTFGLFTARIRTPEPFSLTSAAAAVPEGLGILRDVFRYVSLTEPPEPIRWILLDLVEVLAGADPERLLAGPSARGRSDDPILHFYETFLAEYDQAKRKRRGVFYTPRELVTYIVRSADDLLRESFGRELGLGDEGITVLDPAAGTLTFVAEACRLAYPRLVETFGDGGAPEVARKRFGQRFFAFELMMAPYAVGHLHVSHLLAGMQCELTDRFPLFLTNALDGRELKQSPLPGMASLSRESKAASDVKQFLPRDGVLVVMGNPPYQGHSANREVEPLIGVDEGYQRADGSWDDGYFMHEGKPLGEANPKWLRDDYVRFLRLAQWKVDRVGEGIVALVTNHGFLDNPTFRGLRESLLRSFDQLFFLDLHGNSKKRERTPDGGRDENVFHIRQGVAVLLLVKKPGVDRGIFRHDLFGRREEKLEWLAAHQRTTTPWKRITPSPPLRLFSASDPALTAGFRRFVPLPEIFDSFSVGVVTGCDAFSIAFDPRTLLARLGRLRAARGDLAEVKDSCSRLGTAELEALRERARRDENWSAKTVPILYRPFDRRFIFYADYLVTRPRRELMRHMIVGPNLGLVVPKQATDGPGALVTDCLIGHKAVSRYNINYLFPLWRHPEAPLFEAALRTGAAGGVPNLAPALLHRLARAYGRGWEGEGTGAAEVFAYLYAVLWSRTYLERYGQELQVGFPRIPFPRDAELFASLSGHGRRLIDLHLLRAAELHPPVCRLVGSGNRRLGSKPPYPTRYRPERAAIEINDQGQAFEGVSPQVWEMRLGGYPVLRQWLRSRAGRLLDGDAIPEFCSIVTALHHSLSVQGEIDAQYPAVEGELLGGLTAEDQG
jgi:Type ISP C-terminal specificity domain/N-6 DNA Methylase